MELPPGPERCYAAHLRGGDELVADDLATALPRTVASVEARTLRGGHVDTGTWELIEATYDQEPRYA